MSRVGELERALRSAWTYDGLAAYADGLLLEGDARGELVALDLRPATHDLGWRRRRRELVLAWLGELADRAGHLVQHGFVHELRDGMAPFDLLDGKLGAVVRGYSTAGGTARVTAALIRLAERERPWLARLAIDYTGEAPLPHAVADAVVAATPNLREVRLSGGRTFRRFEHPAKPEVVEGAPVASRDQLQLLLDAIATTPDCNALRAVYEHAFDEPLDLLLARACVARLVAIDGPMVQLLSVESPPPGGRPRLDLPTDDLALHVALEAATTGPRTCITPARRHCELVDACRARLPLCDDDLAELRHHVRSLTDYGWATLRLVFDSVERRARALHAILELRAWYRDELPDDAEAWRGLEEIATLMAMRPARRGVTFTTRPIEIAM